MGKPLSEMSLAELWELFPIILTEHDPRFFEQYAGEAALLGERLKGAKLSHIGSTAVEGIWAKPIVDILVELEPGAPMEADCGYLGCNTRYCRYPRLCSGRRIVGIHNHERERAPHIAQ